MSNKSGIGDNVISLPQGGGAQQGMGETFSPDLFTGTGNFSVPIAVPAGRNGFQPQLSLGYSTGNGNSAFGLGWGISVPGIMRKTNKGIPIYDDEQDTFVLSGAEDLVLINKQSTTTDDITHHQWKYRPRTEGLFARIIHHKTTDGKDYWEVKSKDGLTSFYGDLEGSSNLFHLSNPAVADNIFAWKLSKTLDVFNNSILYHYTQIITDNKEHLAVQHYLSQIQYMNYDDAGAEKFLCSVKFNYEDRPDPFSEGRAGFEVRTTLRCTSVESFTHPKDADLPAGYTADPEGNNILVKRYDIRYQDEITDLPLNGASVLSEIQVSGYDAVSDKTESMPPISFGYTEFEPQSRDFFPLEGKALPTQSLAAPELELADLDGNGLPDFIEMNGQTVRFWKNLGNGKFALPQLMKNAPAFSLADPEVQLMDADGDGRIDLVVSKPGINGYFPLNHEGSWDSNGMKRYKTAPSFSFADPEVKMLDLNGNGITDVLRSGGRFENFYQQSCNQACHAERSRSVKAEGWSGANTSNRGQLDIFPNVNFSNPHIKLADMNGDGLQDIVQVENGSIWYWPNLGHGKWGKRRTMKRSVPNAEFPSGSIEVPETTAFLFPSGWDPRRAILGDVVGNGTADLIYLDNGKIHLWINQSGNQWSEKITIKGTPAVYNADAVRLVDLLGTGVAGLLFTYNVGEGGLANQSSYFLDFTQGVKPYVMNSMNNNMGAITKVSYESSVHAWMEDNVKKSVTEFSSGLPGESIEVSDFRPWKTTLPFPVQVVAKTEVIDEISKGKLVTQYHYSHGYWDGYEREFRGFGRVEQSDTESFERYNAASAEGHNVVNLTQYSPPTKSINWFHLGGINQADTGKKERFYEADFSDEYWQADPNVLKHTQSTKDLLNSLEPHDRRDAFRAWRGSKLRTELYAADTDGTFSSALSQTPFTVSEAQFGLRLEGHGIESFANTSTP
ncbi:MAG: SpvB/TcaC N-terminal domain-containing protein, partial [Flavobacteriales bacterium]